MSWHNIFSKKTMMCLPMIYLLGFPSNSLATAWEEFKDTIESIKEFTGPVNDVISIANTPIEVYEFLKDLFTDQPDLLTKLDEALVEITTEVNDVLPDEYAGWYLGLKLRYDEFFMHQGPPDHITLDEWLSKSAIAIGVFQQLIDDPGEAPISAYKAAKALNLLIMLRGPVLLLDGYTKEAVLNQYHLAYQLNLILLGGYCYDEGNYNVQLPCYKCYGWDSSDGKLALAKNQVNSSEFYATLEAVWSANEFYRKVLGIGNGKYWFNFYSFEAGSGCILNTGEKVNYTSWGDTLKTKLFDFISGNGEGFYNYMWEVKYISHYQTNIISPDGLCLTAMDSNILEPYHYIQISTLELLPCENNNPLQSWTIRPTTAYWPETLTITLTTTPGGTPYDCYLYYTVSPSAVICKKYPDIYQEHNWVSKIWLSANQYIPAYFIPIGSILLL